LNEEQKRANEKQGFQTKRLLECYWQNTALLRFKMSLFGAVWLADLRLYGLEYGKPMERPVLRKPFSRRKNSELVGIAVYGKNSDGIVPVLHHPKKKRVFSINEWSSEFE
jgi:hypothetical protein